MSNNVTTAHMPETGPETVSVDKHSVSCDGGGGSDGHPKVFMDMGQADSVDCKYCGKRFVFKA